MPSAYPFAFAAARYLEPPTRSHDDRCATENGVWYRCDCCGNTFDELEGVRNVCGVCGTFAKRTYDCTCEWIWSE